jgi:sugar lactone lactonase YvrE
VFEHALRDIRQILFRNSEQNAIPAMDGALSPNDRLDDCLPIGEPIAGADDVVGGRDGEIYVSAGNQVFRLSGAGFVQRDVVTAFDGTAGGLAVHPDGRLLVCVAGRGLAALDPKQPQPQWLEAVEGEALVGLTGVVAAENGAIFMVEGSQGRKPDEWCRDLLEKNHRGRLMRCEARLNGAAALLRNMHYPYGVALSADQQYLWWTESWLHRVSRAAIAGNRIATPEPVRRNLPGYPARLHRDATGGFWLGLFGLRTHLIEFVLKEDDFRQEMLATVPPNHWVAPALSSGDDCLEPMQIGSVKALGIQKPWAPPRSYGLLAHIDEDGEVTGSLHSRVGGRYHGITAACETAQGIVVVSKGSGRVLLVAREARV